jgi:hypothetical protein
MKVPNVPPMVLLAGVAAVAAAAYVLMQRRAGETVASAAGRVLVETATDAGAGAVKAIGAQVGIPETDTDQCSADLAAGRWWDASFSCPAPRYLKALAARPFINAAAIDGPAPTVYSSIILSEAQAADARHVFAQTDPRRLDL